jgi:CRISPR-associated protein Cmr2
MSSIYTAISFAPVQGFIEKSRKLRDLYGASLILSYLSQKLVQEFHQPPELEVISPGLINVQEGMPNRILIKGLVDRDRVKNSLLKHWQHLLKVCREWVERNVPADYHWSQTEEQVGKEKGEWERWGSYAWEIFVGWGKYDPEHPDKNLIKAAMDDLETRKLKRDWTAINWVGESSSLSGTDAIAWPRLGEKRNLGKELTSAEKLQFKDEQELFYRRLSWLLDYPEWRIGKHHLSLTELRAHEQKHPDDIGRYIDVNERLSVPELVKRLVTYDKIDANEPEDQKLKIAKLKKKPNDPEFKDIYRKAGYWTGWFMGDGDKVGDKLKHLADRNPTDIAKRDQDLIRFSELMRIWGETFKKESDEKKSDFFPGGKGRVIYAGGDDFLGVLYSEETQTQAKPEKVKPIEAWHWLLTLPQHWQQLQTDLKQELAIDLTYSVGFVWAGHQVPQRDVLQHCREAEKLAKSKGRDRVTIRVVFNSGQFVQWTCPWDYLHVLQGYRDRDGNAGTKASWTHLYNDWAQLQARHAINPKDSLENVDDRIALALFDLYFSNQDKSVNQTYLIDHCLNLTGKEYSAAVMIEWLDGLVKVGWQLCSNF